MTSREKVLDVERQLRAMRDGEQEHILHCPFCGLDTDSTQQALCCPEVAEVVMAVLNHMSFLRSTERLDQVLDNAQKANAAILN